jgi:hypothetical protein
MAGDKTYITDGNGKLHRATRTHKVTPESIVWSSNPNDYAVQVRIDGKWHRAFLTMDAGTATYFDNINIDKALVTGGDGKTHTVLICSPEASVTMSSIKTDQHSLVAGTTTGETAVNVYSETWSNVQWQDNVNVYKVLVTGSDGKVHTALLTTSVTGGSVEVIIKGTSPLVLPDAIANSLSYVKAFGGTEQRNVPSGYTEIEYIETTTGTEYIDPQVTGNARWVVTAQTNAVKGSSQSLIASTDSASGGSWYGEFTTTGHWDIKSDGTNIAPTTKTTADLTFDGNGASGTIGSTSVSREIAVTQGNWRIFGTASGIGPYVGKLFSAKVYQNGVLVRDFVPAIAPNTEVGLYDKISGQFFTNQGTGTFVAGPTAVPTPDAPIDIVCNNGVLKATRPSGLPAGYTALEYIESSGTQYIDTGVKVTQNNRVEVRYCYHTESSIGTSGRITGSRYTSGTSRNAFSMGTQNGKADSTTQMFTQFGTNGTAYAGPRVVIGDWFTAKSSTDGYYVNDTAYQTPISTGDFETPYTVKLFAFEQSAPGGDPTVGCGVGRCADFKIYTNNVLTMNLVPAKNSEGTIGMYDIVNDVFHENAGTGDFVAGPNAVDPITIVADGTVETINVHGKNLLNQATEEIGYIDSSGNVIDTGAAGLVSRHSALIPVTVSNTYVFSGKTADAIGTYNKRVHGYDSNGTWVQQISFTQAQQNSDYSVIATVPTGVAYIKLSYNGSDTEVQLELGSTATEYAPYYDGGTATAEMLLKVGNYQDEQEILSGAITRKVGVLILDGTEDWVQYTTGSVIRFSITNPVGFDIPLDSNMRACCNILVDGGWQDSGTTIQNGTFSYVKSANGVFFRMAPNNGITTVEGWQQWLADQYAAGTPVIVVYPLATPTTESVAGQTLQVTDGDNTLEITQASLTGLELEAQYNAAVSLTIQEVQDANLDNNVTVTIQ